MLLHGELTKRTGRGGKSGQRTEKRKGVEPIEPVNHIVEQPLIYSIFFPTSEVQEEERERRDLSTTVKKLLTVRRPRCSKGKMFTVVILFVSCFAPYFSPFHTPFSLHCQIQCKQWKKDSNLSTAHFNVTLFDEPSKIVHN